MFQKIREQDKTSEKDFNNMEINSITEKEFKMSSRYSLSLSSGEEWINTLRTSTKRKHKKVPKRSHKAEDYNSWTEIYTR